MKIYSLLQYTKMYFLFHARKFTFLTCSNTYSIFHVYQSVLSLSVSLAFHIGHSHTNTRKTYSFIFSIDTVLSGVWGWKKFKQLKKKYQYLTILPKNWLKISRIVTFPLIVIITSCIL